MNPPHVVIAHTDRTWFDNLSRIADRVAGRPARVDEVNFWSPNTVKPIRNFHPGEPVFFRLGAPTRSIAGYGFFADHLALPDVYLAWRLFGVKNGAASMSELARILKRPRPEDLRRPLGCMLLRDATFWSDAEWIPWGVERGYALTGVQRGRADDDPARVAMLMATLQRDAVEAPLELAPTFQLVADDGRQRAPGMRVVREGQGTFRARLIKAYDGQCAVTGEHTLPVLDAAHIQRYLGPASNHVQNGLLLTKEFHTLLDEGLVCVEPKGGRYALRVSNLLQERWNNGRRYREYDGQELRVPDLPELRPSAEALEWHRDVVFEQVA